MPPEFCRHLLPFFAASVICCMIGCSTPRPSTSLRPRATPTSRSSRSGCLRGRSRLGRAPWSAQWLSLRGARALCPGITCAPRLRTLQPVVAVPSYPASVTLNAMPI